MLRSFFIAVALMPFLLSSAHAAGSSAGKAKSQKLESVTSIRPIFSQLLVFSLPLGFEPAYENATGTQYIHESVLHGETYEKWTEMITVTGTKGIASDPNLSTPHKYAEALSGRYQGVCPKSHSVVALGDMDLDGFDAFAAVLGCGVASPSGKPYSESALFIIIKGQKDYYTIQWAERGKPSDTPIKFDKTKWTARLKKILPISLCPAVPGEAAPYPSCIEKKVQTTGAPRI
jgi:hypothetical protein